MPLPPMPPTLLFLLLFLLLLRVQPEHAEKDAKLGFVGQQLKGRESLLRGGMPEGRIKRYRSIQKFVTSKFSAVAEAKGPGPPLALVPPVVLAESGKVEKGKLAGGKRKRLEQLGPGWNKGGGKIAHLATSLFLSSTTSPKQLSSINQMARPLAAFSTPKPLLTSLAIRRLPSSTSSTPRQFIRRPPIGGSGSGEDYKWPEGAREWEYYEEDWEQEERHSLAWPFGGDGIGTSSKAKAASASSTSFSTSSTSTFSTSPSPSFRSVLLPVPAPPPPAERLEKYGAKRSEMKEKSANGMPSGVPLALNGPKMKEAGTQNVLPTPPVDDPLQMTPSNCHKMESFSKMFGVAEPRTWARTNCFLLRLYVQASCAEIDRFIASCAKWGQQQRRRR